MKQSLIIIIAIFSFFYSRSQAQYERYNSLVKALETPEKVKYLSLAEQNLSKLDPRIKELENLEILDLSNNNFSKIPDEVFSLKKLKELYIRGAHSYIDKYEKDVLISSIPSQIKELQNLEILDLSYNNISKIPEEISGLKKLKSLILYHNDLNDKNLIPICNLKQLKSLDIGGNELEKLPNEFSNLTKLDSLHLNNSWSEGVPSGTNLENFPQVITQLKSLKVLSLSGHFFESIPTEIIKLSKLKELYLYDSKFSKLPEEITQLKKLEILNIDVYCIGEMENVCKQEFIFPKEICRMKNLKSLTVSSRKINAREKNRLESCHPGVLK